VITQKQGRLLHDLKTRTVCGVQWAKPQAGETGGFSNYINSLPLKLTTMRPAFFNATVTAQADM
jgi:hypothetical protein